MQSDVYSVSHVDNPSYLAVADEYLCPSPVYNRIETLLSSFPPILSYAEVGRPLEQQRLQSLDHRDYELSS